MSEHDYKIRDLGRSTLVLRSDLIFTPQTAADKSGYIIEDPANSKFYRIGLPEYTFISLLDGRTSVRDALAITASALPDGGLSEQDAATICKWLVDTELAHTAESAAAGRLISAARKAGLRRQWQRFNPMCIRVPLFRPDRVFTLLAPWLSWLFSLPALLTWLTVVLLAGGLVLARWNQFSASSEGILARGNWLYLGLCWLLLKFVHETAHGLVCKKYGGNVREAGVMLILFAPIAYVDVTSSWRFRSKWQRINTSLAGMYVELFIAAVAAVLWSQTGAGVFNHLCVNVVIMASVTTILFNANPLMRFDGYYVLSDFVEMPNLYSNGQQYVSYWARRYLLGMTASCPSWARVEGIFIRVYGVAAMAWRVLVCACLVIAATALFHGAGIVLAAAAVVLWIGVPAARLVRSLTIANSWERPNRLRCLYTAGAAAGLTAILMVVPWPGPSRAPGIVEYAPLTIVRAGSPGFIREVHVRGGQSVQLGQTLVVLANEELEFELADLQRELQQSELRSRMHENQRKMAEYQAELEKAAALRKRIHEKRLQVDRLEVRASSSGQIIGRNLNTLLGTYVTEGAQIFAIGKEQQKEMQLSIAQHDVDAFAACLGKPVTVRLAGSQTLAGPLVKLEPRATVKPPHASLCAPAGGPLTVKAKENRSDNKDATDYEFLTPRFTATIQLDSEQSSRLRAGKLATISARSYHESVGGHFYNQVARWVRDKLGAQNHASRAAR